MLIDKDFVFDNIVAIINQAAPVHQVDASYQSTNHPDDVARIRGLMEQYGVSEDFYFFTTSTERELSLCGPEYMSVGTKAAMATTINGINTIAFDMTPLEFMLENGMSFGEVMEHELIHLGQLETGRMRVEPGKIFWTEDGVTTEYPAEVLNIMDPLMFDSSLAFQMALPWEREAYAPEVARGGNTPRAHAVRLASELCKAAHASIAHGNRQVMDLVRWTELAMTLMIFKYNDYDVAEINFDYTELDSNINVRTNQMRELAKSLMSEKASTYQEYCRRTC